MSSMPAILLTGATGLLGRHLLRDLLASGYRVGVLVKDGLQGTASDRLEELHAFGSETLGQKLPKPVLLHGDLTMPHLGLGVAERHWLAREAKAVIHSAAKVSYRPTADGEPYETNVRGTRRLLELCQSVGVVEFHHLSTAFVCGDRRGTVYEDELDCGNGSSNAYEQSKFAGEKLIRGWSGIRTTVYRPSVIVGDSRTGYTSTYHHFYRFLELAVRLSSGPANTGSKGKPIRQRLPIRLPLSGDETQNLVPVDWVSRAIIQLLHRPQWHGRTYHVVARQPVRLKEIKGVIEDLLGIEGIEWIGRDGLADPTSLEQLVLEQFQDYWSYLQNDLVFDCRNTRLALPDLPPPSFDRELVIRLLRFAQEDNWGREANRLHKQPGKSGKPARMLNLAHYLERVLPEQVGQSPVARALPRGLSFALDINGPGGGHWICRCTGQAIEVQRSLDPSAPLTYRTDVSTFEDLIRGRQTAQQAFFEGRIEIEGNMEKALMLATLIEQFLAAPVNRLHKLPGELQAEAFHAVAGR